MTRPTEPPIMTQLTVDAQHRRFYGEPRSSCTLCKSGEPLYVVVMEDGGESLAIHERHLEKCE